MFFGEKAIVREIMIKVARNGELSTTPNVGMASATLDAVSVHQTVLLKQLISVFHAKSILMEEDLEKFLDVLVV